MDLTQLVVLAIVQGVTEFLPISSQAHNIMVLQLMGLADDTELEVLLNVALHFGSLFAVVIYFWSDMRDAIRGPAALVSDLAARRPLSWPAQLALLLVIATVPVVVFYVVLDAAGAIEPLRTIEVIGWTTLIFGVALYVGDRLGASELELRDWGWRGAVMMGAAQAFALIPGVSRSGVVMTMGRFLGFDRREAARIALLMGVPAILAATAKGVVDLIEVGDVQLTMDVVIATVLSFISAYVAIMLMMRWLQHATFTPFVVYRLGLGAVLLWTAYAT